jgi:Adenylate kinase
MMNRLSIAGLSIVKRSLAARTPLVVGVSSSTPTLTTKRTIFGDDYNDTSWYNAYSESSIKKAKVPEKPGSKAFVSSIEETAVLDLFFQYAKIKTSGKYGGKAGLPALDVEGVRCLLKAIGEKHDDVTAQHLFDEADLDNSGCVDLQEFMLAADKILGSSPARIVLIVGGPGSGKGLLSARLEKETGLVHLSSGDLLRSEVQRGTVLGKQVHEIMARGELVSSEIIVTLMRRRMRDHPGKRVLLDGFPR